MHSRRWLGGISGRQRLATTRSPCRECLGGPPRYEVTARRWQNRLGCLPIHSLLFVEEGLSLPLEFALPHASGVLIQALRSLVPARLLTGLGLAESVRFSGLVNPGRPDHADLHASAPVAAGAEGGPTEGPRAAPSRTRKHIHCGTADLGARSVYVVQPWHGYIARRSSSPVGCALEWRDAWWRRSVQPARVEAPGGESWRHPV